MALEQKLSLKLAQKLVMTPSLQQAIKLLQMTRLELDGVLNQELEENPVLEEGEGQEEEEAPAAEELVNGEVDKEVADALGDVDFEAFFGDDDTWENAGSSSLNEEREGPPLENRLTREPDLYDHLLWQLRMADVPDDLREIAELVIGNLTPDGFLVATVEEIQAMGTDGFAQPAAESTRYSLAAVEAAFELVRGFDPPGVACASLQECLLRQLEMRGESEDSLTWRVLSETWEFFKRRKFDAVAKHFGISMQELQPVVEAIRCLETRPGRQFNSDTTHYVEPDVYVVKVGDEYIIQLNDDGMPRLRVSSAYRRMLQAMRRDGGQGEAQQFIKDKMRSALWLIKSLDQRQRTIYKVASSIVRQQREFLDHGIERLRPMVLRDVAEDIDMHESTVSRVVSNKYMHTPRGLFPMKFFFHSAIDREYGGDISSLSVKQKIQHLVQEENSKKPLSDSELMRILKREGIQIARRTVAKYRDELRIPSSTERKKLF